MIDTSLNKPLGELREALGSLEHLEKTLSALGAAMEGLEREAEGNQTLEKHLNFIRVVYREANTAVSFIHDDFSKAWDGFSEKVIGSEKPPQNGPAAASH